MVEFQLGLPSILRLSEIVGALEEDPGIDTYEIVYAGINDDFYLYKGFYKLKPEQQLQTETLSKIMRFHMETPVSCVERLLTKDLFENP